MKLTLEKIFNALPVINELMKTKISIKASFKLSLLFKDLRQYYRMIEEKRQILLKELKKLETDKGGKVIHPEKVHELDKKFRDMLQLEIEFKPKFLIELNDLEEVKLTPEEVALIEDFIKPDEVKNEQNLRNNQ
jgi:hypothetical protein